MPESVFYRHPAGLRFAFFLIIIAIVFKAQGQICNGSLGDPAVNITFGPTGGTANFPPPGGYTYTPSTCPNDGYYTVTGSTSNCFGNTWHTVSSDHTGS